MAAIDVANKTFLITFKNNYNDGCPNDGVFYQIRSTVL